MVMKVSSLENSHEMKNIIEMLIEAEEDLCEDAGRLNIEQAYKDACLLYTSPSPRDSL